MNYKRLALILISVLFLQSCGLKFWYNRLDWLVTWQIDDYVELSSAQEDRLEAFIRQKTEWHRQTQLPIYIQFIDDFVVLESSF